MANYIVGQEITLTVQFTNAANEPTDPLTVNLYYQEGGSSGPSHKHTVVGGQSSAQITRTGEGAYEHKHVVALPGVGYWRWEAPDEEGATIIDAYQGTFCVDPEMPIRSNATLI